jgi:D-Tyr-tRNAtyr deacylase
MLRQQAEESKQNYEKLQAKVKEQRIQIDEKEKRKKEIETKKFEVRLLFSSLVLDGFEKYARPI